MFIIITTDKENTIELNTSQICYIDENNIQMSNGFTIKADEDSLKELLESLHGEGDTKEAGASEYTTTLLNDINQMCGGSRDAKPTTDRKARLKARLKDFSEEELKIAAKNLGQDEFMQGANDNNKRYGTIDYLIRTSANVNKWLEDQPEKKKKGMF